MMAQIDPGLQKEPKKIRIGKLTQTRRNLKANQPDLVTGR